VFCRRLREAAESFFSKETEGSFEPPEQNLGSSETVRSTHHVSNYPFPNRTGTFRRIRLSPAAAYLPRTAAPSGASLVLIARIQLGPFPVYRALPRSFEYYEPSVTMSLSAFR
jgi:hypothetical protein